MTLPVLAYVLLGGIAGFIVGWLLRAARLRRIFADRYHNIETRLAARTTELQEMQVALEQDSRAAALRLADTHARYRETIGQMSDQLTRLEPLDEQYAQHQEEICELEERESAYEAKIAKLISRVHALGNAVQQAEENENALLLLNTTLQSNLEEKECHIAQLQQTNEALLARLGERETLVASLRDRLQSVTTDFEEKTQHRIAREMELESNYVQGKQVRMRLEARAKSIAKAKDNEIQTLRRELKKGEDKDISRKN